MDLLWCFFIIRPVIYILYKVNTKRTMYIKNHIDLIFKFLFEIIFRVVFFLIYKNDMNMRINNFFILTLIISSN